MTIARDKVSAPPTCIFSHVHSRRYQNNCQYVYEPTTLNKASQLTIAKGNIMCDISDIRKPLVILLLPLLNCVSCNPQLNYPQYDFQDNRYPNQNINPPSTSFPPGDFNGNNVGYYGNRQQQPLGNDISRNPNVGDVGGLLQALDIQASQQCTNNVAAQWNFETNVNQATQLEAVSTLLLVFTKYVFYHYDLAIKCTQIMAIFFIQVLN